MDTRQNIPPDPPEDPDLAPDADEPGDDLPEELADFVHDGPIVQDNVDKQRDAP